MEFVSAVGDTKKNALLGKPVKLTITYGKPVPKESAILKVASIGISGPFNMMLRSPVMGQRMFAMLDYLRFNTSVPRKLNEFAILIQARLWTSQVE
jgi:hypothetical protein